MDEQTAFAAVADSTWLIALAAAVLLFIIWKCSTTTSPPPPPPPAKRKPLVVRDYTRAELAKFDGNDWHQCIVMCVGRQQQDDKTILIGVLGRVYDVSSAATFYGPGGPYELFAGQDATMVLARV